MKVAIIGYGLEGKSAAKYWRGLGADITVCDRDENIDAGDYTAHLGPDYLQGLNHFDVIVRTAGLNPATILAVDPGIKTKMTTLVNEFLRVCPTKHVIGVTGTKGKGTTTALITRMLQAAGKEVFWGGNIGVPPFDFLPDLTPDSWVVLELSSFQLYDVQHSPHIGVCLMVVPEHLNWHGDMDDYIQAKARLFKYQSPQDTAIYFADNELSHRIASHSPGAKIPYFASPGAYVQDGFISIDAEQICHVDELKLLGEHNWQNACAAVTAAWQVTKDTDAIRAVLTTFAGLPHRLEFIREVDGVKYYNDSFAATPDAAIVALSAIKGPKVVIMGGFDRNLPLEHLAQAVADHSDIRKVVAIGESNRRLAEEFDQAGFSNYFLEDAKSMAEIVATANMFVTKGDVVLLSPGFSSFDMFKNFVDRGEQFKAVVKQL